MLYNRLIELIAADAGQMAALWKAEIKKSENASHYHRLSDHQLLQRCRDVYENLGKWLERDFDMIRIGKEYVEVGRQRYREGFPLCQVQFALHLTKKVLWNHILCTGTLNTALEIYQALDLFIRVQNFFDIASFFIIRGYMGEIYSCLDSSHEIDVDALHKIFPDGSFVFEIKPEDIKRSSKP